VEAVARPPVVAAERQELLQERRAALQEPEVEAVPQELLEPAE
jgi:hypothetical protein